MITCDIHKRKKMWQRFRLHDALERGPLGALAAPETGFVFDAARAVWDRLRLPDKVALYIASWPHAPPQWTLLVKYTQGRRVEYGPFTKNEFGFGEHLHKSYVLAGLGLTIDLDSWIVTEDYEQLNKLFTLLKRYKGLEGSWARHACSVEAWRGFLIRLL